MPCVSAGDNGQVLFYQVQLIIWWCSVEDKNSEQRSPLLCFCLLIGGFEAASIVFTSKSVAEKSLAPRGTLLISLF